MSAFIVEDKTINRILTWLWYSISDGRHDWLYRQFKENGYVLITENDFRKLGRDMLKMNVDAVNYRYDKDIKPSKDFQFSDEKASVFQVLKSLRCFLYQCNEGNVPRRKLFKLLELLRNSITDEIIDQIPAYENAEWG